MAGCLRYKGLWISASVRNYLGNQGVGVNRRAMSHIYMTASLKSSVCQLVGSENPALSYDSVLCLLLSRRPGNNFTKNRSSGKIFTLAKVEIES